MITADEEVGGKNGVGKLLDSGFAPQYAFLPDGGNNFKIERSAKGTVNYEITSKGKSAHSSRPWLGYSAVEKLINLLEDIRREFMLEPCKLADHYHNTISIVKINGGTVVNSVADFARATLNIRFIPKYNLKQIREIIKRKTKKYHNISFKENISFESCRFNNQSFFTKVFLSILKKYYIKPEFIDSHGTSDGRYFALKNIPIILTRPKGGGHHSENEWINLKSLDKFYKILEEFIKTLPAIKFKRNL
jgi:acetylornithine deacetylase/succinyl-diaminopimelate desuccinylase-like protein